MNTPLNLPEKLPPAIPQFSQHMGRRLARWVIECAGWQLTGEFPNLPKLVVIVAPHSSWWDGWWGMFVKVALGMDIVFMAKQELFWGPLGWLLRQLGGIPIDRSAGRGVADQMVERFRHRDKLWIGIAPEGTRKHVDKWKSGFWHIAHRAGVPILAVYFHYPEKTIGVGSVFEPSADLHADMAKIREFYRPWQGKNRGTV